MKKIVILLVLFTYHQCFISDVNGLSSKENLERLKKDLLKDYVKPANPGTITLDFSLQLLDLEFNSDLDVLTVKALEKHVWTDDRLTWKPRNYGGIKKIKLPDTYLWTPDIFVLNMYGASQTRIEVYALVSSDGQITWSPDTEFKVRCNRYDVEYDRWIDLREAVRCDMKFFSYTYDEWIIDLISSNPTPDTTQYRASSGLEVGPMRGVVDSITYPCSNVPWKFYNVTMDVVFPEN